MFGFREITSKITHLLSGDAKDSRQKERSKQTEEELAKAQEAKASYKELTNLKNILETMENIYFPVGSNPTVNSTLKESLDLINLILTPIDTIAMNYGKKEPINYAPAINDK